MLFRCIVIFSALTKIAYAEVSFNNDIRPLLSNHCYRCHGPDENERKAGLRLDTFDGATKDHDGIKALVPNNIDESEIIYRITSTDPDEVMPPPNAGDKLNPEQINTIKQWISEGGKYEKHWSYQKPKRPVVPNSNFKASIKNPIDNFIHNKLEENDLKPSPEASKATLIRRASLDITGLPPTKNELEQYLQDQDENAYEKMIDRLLAKESYGEHWARMWLDLARYADSAGYADDPPRTIWAYRDYVIRSFNNNKPFDQFTLEQIAGDLLENPNQDQLVATAFHRNTQTNNEGGTNDEEYRNVAIVDRVNTTMATWMGTTMACAQCHTHKYDPISHEDYFKTFAIFNQTQDADRRDESPIIKVMSQGQRDELKDLEEKIKKLENELVAKNEVNLKALDKWENGLKKESKKWKPLRSLILKADSGATFNKLDDESYLVSGKEAPTDTYHISANSTLEQITAIKIETLTHESLSHWKGPGRKGNFVLNEIILSSAQNSPTKKGRYVRIDLPGNGKMIHLAEVEVFSGNTNVALKGIASQSSDYSNAKASRAIDGNTNGDYNKGSVSHTATGKNDPFWEVDLKSIQDISRIIIWNRTDGTVSSRLDGYKLSILDKDRKTIWEKTFSKAPTSNEVVSLSGEEHARFSKATSSFDQEKFGVSLAIDGDDGGHSGWAVGPNAGMNHHAVFELQSPFKHKDIKFTLKQTYAEHAIGRLRISVTDKPLPQRATPIKIAKILQTPKEKRSDQQISTLLEHLAEINPFANDLSSQLVKAKDKIKSIKPSTTVPVMRQLGNENLRKTHIQIRGNYLSKGKEVTPGIPAIFDQPVQVKSPNRLTLAKWLVNKENPLTSRVMTNRLWEKIFGVGIVATSEEFGSQGELPSHPELLDWLAIEFMENGWDMKSLLKLIVTSSTYRQDSLINAEHREKDPFNRWYSRGPRFRLSAEMIRDQALSVSGLLSTKMYGAPVRPPQPNLGVKAAFGGGIDWKTSEGEDRYRRGIYTNWRRSNPYPSMTTFDAPNREVCVVRRDRTNTPLQALVTLNDPVYVEAAVSLARKMYRVAKSENNVLSGLQEGFQLCLSRTAKEDELGKISKLFNQSLKHYENNPELANLMTGNLTDKNNDSFNNSRLAALTVVGNVLLNLDEFLMKR